MTSKEYQSFNISDEVEDPELEISIVGSWAWSMMFGLNLKGTFCTLK